MAQKYWWEGHAILKNRAIVYGELMEALKKLDIQDYPKQRYTVLGREPEENEPIYIKELRKIAETDNAGAVLLDYYLAALLYIIPSGVDIELKIRSTKPEDVIKTKLTII